MLYIHLANLYEELTTTSKRLHKIYLLSQFLKKNKDQELKKLLLLVQGKLFADWEDKKIGLSSKLVLKALQKTTGMTALELEKKWKELGDLGDVAKNVLAKKTQASLFPKELSLNQVFSSLHKLSDMEGKGSIDQKLSVLLELLVDAKPIEAKYLVRTVVDNLRVGMGSGSMRDALIWAFVPFEIPYDEEKNTLDFDDDQRKEYNEIIEKVQHALDITNDYCKVALLLLEKGVKGLSELSLEVGNPINVMLYQKAKDIKDAFSIVGKPAAWEMKYDGFRMQIHCKIKNNETDITLYTRRLENVTVQFPDVVEFLKKTISKPCILDAEAVGYDPQTKKYLPFQSISQRIRRKYDIDEIAKKFPVELNIFDIMSYDGENHLKTPYEKRRELLSNIIKEEPFKIVLAKQIITDSEEEAQQFVAQSYAEGEEGAMAKNLQGIYKPGSRVGYGVKIKSIMEPLDLVIVAGEYGEGKRSGWFSSFVLACDDNGELKEIGRVSTGFKELEQEEGVTFKKMTELLTPLVIKDDGKIVEFSPEIVIEVGYEEIQKSQSYSSGYALRFPRFLRLRIDEKDVNTINTLDHVELFYKHQRGRSN